MQSEWQLFKVADLIAQGNLFVGDGYRAKNNELTVSGLPFARAGNIDNGFHFSDADCFPEGSLARVGNKISSSGDVVFTSKGTVGRFAFVRESTPRFVYSPQLCFWRSLDINVIDTQFLYYWMTGPDFYSQFKSVAGQTDMAEYVSLTDQRRMNIRLPPLPEQKAIARVLSSLDDKIELNRRINANLESLAQTLFRAWFVDFEPVKAKAAGLQPPGMDAETTTLFPSEFEESALGLIPKGWEIVPLNTVYEIYDNRRIPLSGKERNLRRGNFPYYGAAAVMDYIDGYLFDGVYVLLGEDGSVLQKDDTPVMQYVWGKFWVNNHAHVMQGANSISTEHLMLALKEKNIAAYVTGAVQLKLNQGNLGRIPFLKPTNQIATTFAEILTPIYNQFRNNTEQSQTIAQLRDALLPRLISGRLRVPEAMRVIEENA